MKTSDPGQRDKALAIEFWILTILVMGSFLVGAWQAIRSFF